MNKNRIRLTESKLRQVIKESVKRVLKEALGNDIDANSIRDQALSVITQMEKEGLPIKWRNVAERMGFRLNTLSDEDFEAMKSRIEMAMLDCDNDNWEDDMEFDSYFRRYL